MGLLKRNAADRFDFDIFFNHPFIRPAVSTAPPARARTSPVKVPSSETTSRQTTPTTTTETVPPSIGSTQSTPKNPNLPLTSVDIINPGVIECPPSTQALSGGITTVVAGRKSPKAPTTLSTTPRGQQTGVCQSPGSNKHLPSIG